MKTFIIAEAGVNHNGNVDLAKKLIDEAVKSKADAIKFQTFIVDLTIAKSASKALYQKINTGGEETQYEMAKKLEFSFDVFRELKNYCDASNIEFLSTPFDLPSVDFLNDMGMRVFKIASGEITNYPLLKKIGGLKKEVILSTGMSVIKEIKEAIKVLVANGTEKNKITILHCNTEYPTPFEDTNLRAMLTLKKTFGTRVGYSDHTVGTLIPLAAVCMGACVIEKHFTLDKTLPGPDHIASIDPVEFKYMVENIRLVEAAMGTGEKKPSPSERKNITIARKSIHAAKHIPKGSTFNEQNLIIKRPGNGISPMMWEKVINKRAKRDFFEDELIEL